MKKNENIEDYDIYILKNKYIGADCTCLNKHASIKQMNKINDILDALEDMCYFDAPDGYCIKEDKVIVFEHFGFDSSRNNRKGSEYRREANILDGKIEEWSQSNEGVIVLENKSLSSSEYLANNFNKQLSSHCNKLENYRKNLIYKGIAKENMSFEFCVLAENTDPNGMSQIDGAEWKELEVWDIKECFENIKNNTFDYLIVFSKSNNEKEIKFRFKEDFAVAEENNLKEAKDIRLFAPKWKTIAGNYRIPKKQ